MGAASSVRSGLRTADRQTADLQVAVTHLAWVGQTGMGGPIFASGVSVQALVEYTTSRVKQADGQDVISTATVSILRPLAANGGTGRQEPVDPRDTFIMPDGRVVQVLAVDGLIDPSTGKPYMSVVKVG